MSNIYLHLLSRICKISISQSKSMYTYTTNTTNTNTQYRHIDAVHVLRARLRRKHTQNPCPATHCCREKKATPPAYTCTYVPPRGWLQQRFQITGTSMCITNMKKNINQYVSTWATPCHRVESFLFYPGPSPSMHNTPPRTRARAGGQTRGSGGRDGVGRLCPCQKRIHHDSVAKNEFSLQSSAPTPPHPAPCTRPTSRAGVRPDMRSVVRGRGGGGGGGPNRGGVGGGME